MKNHVILHLAHQGEPVPNLFSLTSAILLHTASLCFSIIFCCSANIHQTGRSDLSPFGLSLTRLWNLHVSFSSRVSITSPSLSALLASTALSHIPAFSSAQRKRKGKGIRDIPHIDYKHATIFSLCSSYLSLRNPTFLIVCSALRFTV